MKKVLKIFIHCIPVIVMIGLIPLIQNDNLLTILYVIFIIGLLFFLKDKKNDLIALFFGLIVITFFEYIFVSTGVEIFTRNSLLGIMPLWLPFLWAYGFVAIKKSLEILNNHE